MSTTLFKVVRSHAAPAIGARAADWRDDALCRSHPNPELWFPKGTDAVSMADERQAKQICTGCPVMAACRRWAVETREDSGVWGGLSERERYNLRRRARSRNTDPAVRVLTFPSIKDAYKALTQKTGRHVIWTGGNEVKVGKARLTPNQVAWQATRRRPPVGRVFTDCETDGCVRHLNDQAMRQARDTQKREAAACGTRSGYQKHKRLGETACETCRQANADADRRLRNTGTTTERSAA
ncbi:WhiB family transcriptional regulator [Streptomyces anulatus]|uniref:WhiB family transcriptional regulator n=1 Tax=Streptomyces anulatus TaxID=1892 RepID=UPI003B79CB01